VRRVFVVGGETGVIREVVLAVVALESEPRRQVRVSSCLAGLIVASEGRVGRVSELMLEAEVRLDMDVSESDGARPSPRPSILTGGSCSRRIGTDNATGVSESSASGGGTPRRPGDTGAEVGAEKPLMPTRT
jgi:hypothetical protein